MRLYAAIALVAFACGAAAWWLFERPRGAPAGIAPAALWAASFADTSGRPVALGQFRGRVIVANFWATWCAPCIEELPSLDQFQRELANQGVVVLGVSVDKDEKAYKRFLDRAKVSFLTARDPDNTINAEYGTFKYPESYIINRDGKVVMKIISATDWTDEKMVSYVKSLL